MSIHGYPRPQLQRDGWQCLNGRWRFRHDDDRRHAHPDEIRDWLYHNAMNERKAKDTDEQFIYKTRKKAIGPFKRDFWNLSAEARAAIGQALEARFAFLFEQLGVRDTARTVRAASTKSRGMIELPFRTAT